MPFAPDAADGEFSCYVEFTYGGIEYTTEEFPLIFVEDYQYALDMPFTLCADYIMAKSAVGQYLAGRFLAYSGTYNDTLYVDVCFDVLNEKGEYQRIKPTSLTMYVVNPNAEIPVETETSGDDGDLDSSGNLSPGDSPNGTPMQTVNFALRAAISWIGTVLYELMHGKLLGLLGMVAIAISVTALLLVCRIIKKFGWGL